MIMDWDYYSHEQVHVGTVQLPPNLKQERKRQIQPAPAVSIVLFLNLIMSTCLIVWRNPCCPGAPGVAGTTLCIKDQNFPEMLAQLHRHILNTKVKEQKFIIVFIQYL